MAANLKTSPPEPMSDFQDWVRHVALDMERALEILLPAKNTMPARLHDAMRYATLGGGKRVRPMLAFAAGLVSDADPERVKIVAAAVEIIHAYSLAHDDLPCMDDDVLRRGKPTCHVEFDEATALLAGDALQALAFELIANYRLADSSETQLKMQQLFVLAIVAVSFLRAWLINLACKPILLSPISPSSSLLGTRAATESITTTSNAPDKINLSAISNACSP